MTDQHLLITCELKRGRGSIAAPKQPWDLDSEHLSSQALAEIRSALEDNGWATTVADGPAALLELARSGCDHFQACINLSVGVGGPSTKVYGAAILDMLGVPYLGSGPSALAVTRDKAVSKAVATSLGIPTPRWISLYPGDSLHGVEPLELPVIVKPIHESSSIGITAHSVVDNRVDIEPLAKRIWSLYGQAALVEEYVAGVDIEVPLMGDPELEALGCVGVVPSLVGDGHSILTSNLVYSDSYVFKETKALGLGSVHETEERAKMWALLLAKATRIRDYGRVDFRMRPDGKLSFIEISTHPYIARHSSFCYLAALAGSTYEVFMAKLLDCVVKRVRQERSEGPRIRAGA